MAEDLAQIFREAIVQGLVNKTLSTPSRWALKKRIMGEPFIGPYSFKYHPWCKELHDAKTSFVTTMKAAQMGVTEVAINLAFYVVDVAKKDVLYVLPTALGASDFSKARFSTALLYSPHLKNLFTDTNTVGLKQAGGVNLYIRGSRGESNLVSIPVSTLILDEVDRMDQKQIWLALERLSGHIDKTIWAISTPTVPEHGIHNLYLLGTQEHYTFKCPHCEKLTELIWPDCIEICGESITDENCRRSFLKCKECKHKLDQETKPEWLSPDTSKWEPTVTGINDHRSFYINQLYSYTINPCEIVIAYFRGQQSETAEVEFHNSKLGVPFVPEGGQVTVDEILKAKRSYTMKDPRPAPGQGTQLICMGIDQGKKNHVVVVEYLIMDREGRDINASTGAKVLFTGTFPGEDFGTLDHLMREWQVLACVIDADPQINDARRFARRFPGYVHLCRYRRGVTGGEQKVAEEDSGAPIVTVDRTNWLDATLGRFHSDRIHLPLDIPNEFIENIKVLVRTYERDDQGNPKAVYINTGMRPDHYAHALNYAEIALPFAAGIGTSEAITERII